VTSIEELNGKVEVYIKSQDGQKQHVTCTFLVGADGKRGYVRKGYLEAKGIRQEVGVLVVSFYVRARTYQVLAIRTKGPGSQPIYTFLFRRLSLIPIFHCGSSDTFQTSCGIYSGQLDSSPYC
jgi:2-polyprenyl-6-methoxyphenol hydroxylase-like FAD-dependent oxidoreductase